MRPVIEARCFPCHSSVGIEATKHDFSTYETLHAQRIDVLSAVHDCLMPPADAGAPLAPEERATLLEWFVCHAPDN